MGEARILLVDNDTDYLKTRKEWLEHHGYDVLTAMDVGGALGVLRDTQIHLAVVNYRLTNDRDEKDSTGLDVLRGMNPTMPRLVTTQLEAQALFKVAQDVLSSVDGLAMAQDVLQKRDEERLLGQMHSLILHRYHLELKVDDSDSIGKLLRWCKAWGIHDMRELDILFQSLFCPRKDCTAVTVTRARPVKNRTHVVQLRIRMATLGKADYFTVLCGTPNEIQIAEAFTPPAVLRGHTLHLAASAHPGNLWDQVLDRLPWLEKIAKPAWEVFKLGLKFVKI